MLVNENAGLTLLCNEYMHPQGGVKSVWVFMKKLAEVQPGTPGTNHEYTALFAMQEVIDTLDDFDETGRSQLSLE